MLGLLLLAFVGSCNDDGTDLVGEPDEVSADEFETAVLGAANELLHAPGIHVEERTRFSSGREEARWIDHRSVGEYAMVEVVEFVGEDGEEGSTRTSVTVVRGVRQYSAQMRSGRPPTRWTALERTPQMMTGHPLSTVIPLFRLPRWVGRSTEAWSSAFSQKRVLKRPSSDKPPSMVAHSGPSR